MLDNMETMIDWSRAQFALTAMYHWLFVPLTLGLAVIMGVMETRYVISGHDFWKRTARFWMRLPEKSQQGSAYATSSHHHDRNASL